MESSLNAEGSKAGMTESIIRLRGEWSWLQFSPVGGTPGQHISSRRRAVERTEN